jgi:hypothetical protein
MADVTMREPSRRVHVQNSRTDPRGAGVAHGFGGPELGVVGDAAVLVAGECLALHDPPTRSRRAPPPASPARRLRASPKGPRAAPAPGSSRTGNPGHAGAGGSGGSSW